VDLFAPEGCESAQKELALRLFEGAFCEGKLAGTLVLQGILLDELTLSDFGALGSLFERELITDWNTCDWFSVKVLGYLVARELPSRTFADEVASWRSARTLWQRRAAREEPCFGARLPDTRASRSPRSTCVISGDRSGPHPRA